VSHVLILGAAGFIGSHLTEHLLAEGHHVSGVDNLLTGHLDNLAQAGSTYGDRFAFTTQCVEDPWHWWTNALLDHRPPLTHVIHLASPASPAWYTRYPIETMRANAEGTYRALHYCRRNGARFVLASTSEVYGDPDQHPQREEYWGNVNPIGPRSMYDEAKRYAEAMVNGFQVEGGSNGGIVRLFNTYGPRMAAGDGRVIPAFLEAARRGEPFPIHGTGAHTRSLCYVDDTIRGIWAYAQSDLTIPVNIGNPTETTILDLASAVARAYSVNDPKVEHLPESPEDPRRRRPSITRARELLGWSPRIGLDEGLRRTIAGGLRYGGPDQVGEAIHEAALDQRAQSA